MFRTDKQLELIQHMSRQGILGQHSLDSQSQQFRRVLFPQINGGDVPLTARPAGKPLIALLGHLGRVVWIRWMDHLATRESHFVSIDDNDIVTRINVWRIVWSVFAHEYRGQSCRQATDCHSFGIYNKPLCLVVSSRPTIRGFQKRRAGSNHNFNLHRNFANTKRHPPKNLGNEEFSDLRRFDQPTCRRFDPIKPFSLTIFVVSRSQTPVWERLSSKLRFAHGNCENSKSHDSVVVYGDLIVSSYDSRVNQFNKTTTTNLTNFHELKTTDAIERAELFINSQDFLPKYDRR